MQINSTREKFRVNSFMKIKYERILQMPIPYSLLNVGEPDCDAGLAWNDPRRKLYPHHAEFWPDEIPEHVCFEMQAIELRKQKQKEWLRFFFRFRWLSTAIAFCRDPRWPKPIFENPMNLQKRPDDTKRR